MNIEEAMRQDRIRYRKKIELYNMTHVNHVKEWIKWIEYTTLVDADKINYVLKRKVESLSISDLEFAIRYKERKNILPLMYKYINNSADDNEKMEVLLYINNNSIEQIIQEKLSYWIVSKSMKETNRVLSLTDEEIMNWINEKINNYENISIEEAFSLKQVGDLYYGRMNADLDIIYKDIIQKELVKVMTK